MRKARIWVDANPEGTIKSYRLLDYEEFKTLFGDSIRVFYSETDIGHMLESGMMNEEEAIQHRANGQIEDLIDDPECMAAELVTSEDTYLILSQAEESHGVLYILQEEK